MSNLKEIVNSLEDKARKLVHHLNAVKEEQKALEKALEIKNDACKKAIYNAAYWEEKYKALKLAQSMLGSDQNTTEAKLKINTLIKELDYCIGALSK